jgi:hypothetical protein
MSARKSAAPAEPKGKAPLTQVVRHIVPFLNVVDMCRTACACRALRAATGAEVRRGAVARGAVAVSPPRARVAFMRHALGVSRDTVSRSALAAVVMRALEGPGDALTEAAVVAIMAAAGMLPAAGGGRPAALIRALLAVEAAAMRGGLGTWSHSCAEAVAGALRGGPRAPVAAAAAAALAVDAVDSPYDAAWVLIGLLRRLYWQGWSIPGSAGAVDAPWAWLGAVGERAVERSAPDPGALLAAASELVERAAPRAAAGLRRAGASLDGLIGPLLRGVVAGAFPGAPAETAAYAVSLAAAFGWPGVVSLAAAVIGGAESDLAKARSGDDAARLLAVWARRDGAMDRTALAAILTGAHRADRSAAAAIGAWGVLPVVLHCVCVCVCDVLVRGGAAAVAARDCITLCLCVFGVFHLGAVFVCGHRIPCIGCPPHVCVFECVCVSRMCVV